MLTVRSLWLFLFEVASLLGYCDAVQSAPPLVSGGYNSSFAIDQAGNLFSWGDDSYGELGQGRLLTRPTFAPVVAPGRFVQVSAYFSANAAVDDQGQVWTWGMNESGGLGNGTRRNTSRPAIIGSGFVSVAQGYTHGVGIKTDRSLWMWGSFYGASAELKPRKIADDVVSATAGYYTVVAVKSDGTLWSMGDYRYGVLGDGTTVNRDTLAQIGTGFKSVSMNESHVLALKQDGSVWSWGENYSGQVGDGTVQDRWTPVKVAEGFSAIAAGREHSCALKNDGTVWAWGRSDTALPFWTGSSPIVTPQLVPLPEKVTGVAAGDYSCLAWTSTGKLFEWGHFSSRLVAGTNSGQMSVLDDGVTSATAGGAHLVILKNGTMKSAGSNIYGELGDGINNFTNIPVKIGSGYSDVRSARYHTLALKQDGSLFAFGGWSTSALGVGDGMDHTTPVLIGTGYISIAAGTGGAASSYAVGSDGRLDAWGSFGGWSPSPSCQKSFQVPTTIGTGYKRIAAGDDLAIGLKSDGSVVAWGFNRSGQVGDGTVDYRCTPVTVGIGSGFIDVAANSETSAALHADGSVYAWGSGLGAGGSSSLVPRKVFDGMQAITVGNGYVAGIRSDGSAWAIGIDRYGSWTTGSQASYSAVPVKIASDVISVSAGYQHLLMVRRDGTVRGTGTNAAGQLGNATLVQSSSSPTLAVSPLFNDFLNLYPGTILNLPAELRVPFLVKADGDVSNAAAYLSTTNKFNATDIGKSGAVYVTALVPRGGLGTTASPTAKKMASPSMKPQGGGSSSSVVLMQLTSSGWQPVTNGQLIPYASGVLGDQLAAQTILNGTDTTNLGGAQFCVGYGTSATSMTNTANMRTVATIPGTATQGSCAAIPLNITQGWNLLGNSVNQSPSVATLFGDPIWVTSVWKWDTTLHRWQFYAPLMDAATLQSFTSSKGYGILTTVNPGEGFWVNANAATTAGIPPGTAFSLSAANLVSGWNLAATSDQVSPSAFNVSLSATPPSSGVVSINLTSLWAWDTPSQKWYFYAPSLEAQGGTSLSSYIGSHGYLDFENMPTAPTGTLSPTTGFWINMP